MGTTKTQTGKSGSAGKTKKRTGSTKTNTRKRKSAPKYTKEQLLIRQMLYLVMCFVAVFLFISVAFDVTGVVGRFIRSLMTGMLGAAAYVLPFAMLFHAVLGVASRPGTRKMHLKAWCSYGMILLIAAMYQMLVQDGTVTEKLWSTFYGLGHTLQSGGVIGGFLAKGLQSLTGTVGAGLILSLLFIVDFMALSGLTVERVFRFFFPIREEDDEESAELEERETLAELIEKRKEQKPLREARRQKKNFNIDLPIDGEVPVTEPDKGFGVPDFEPVEMPPVPQSLEEILPLQEEPELEPDEIEVQEFTLQPEPEPELELVEEFEPETLPLQEEPAAPFEQEDPFVREESFEQEDPLGEKPFQTQEYHWGPAQQQPPSPEPAAQEPQAAPADKPAVKPYEFPPLELLEKGARTDDRDNPARLRENAKKITDTLKSFHVDATVVNISVGPTVTRYELSPSAGVKISKITSLADDIALNLAAAGVRIEAPIPGKAAVGLEVPNAKTSTVYIRDVIDTNEFRTAKSDLAFALGRDITGQVVIGDIAKMPHVLIAGATGSGKSVCINTILASILYKSSPDKVKLLMVDPKVVELGVYNGIPHLLVPVVTDPKKAAGSLNWAVSEMLKRYQMFADKNVRDMRGYNQVCELEGDLEPLPHIVIIIDELSDLMMAAPNEVEDAICRLAQMARAAGMHLVIATQRPSVDVITGTIKANIPSRIAFAVSSQVDSRTILDMSGAEKLLGKGDMLYYPVGAVKPIRVQGCFISDKEVEAVTKFVKEGGTVSYDDKVMEEIEKRSDTASNSKGGGDAADSDGSDELLPAAVEVVLDAGMASVSLLQRKLKLGYARAARIVDELHERGIVGPFEGAKPRTVKITRAQWQEMQARSGDDLMVKKEDS